MLSAGLRVPLICAAVATMAGCWGCTWWPTWNAAERITITTVEVGPAVTVTALHAYRLVVTPEEAARGSRLVVLSARIETPDDSPLRFRPTDVTLTLPDGTAARAFDRARAQVLLERVEIEVNDTSPVSGRRTRLDPAARKRLKRQVIETLLDEADFTHDQPLQGHLVVDVRTPVTSLDGAQLEVVVSRLSDAAPARQVYWFGPKAADQQSAFSPTVP